MTKIAIIIPSRLDAQRLPNKPLELINEKEMILHVHDLAIKSKVGEVFVATPDKKIQQIVIEHGGNSIITSKDHVTGTDRVFEVFNKHLKSETDIIINLQGDMPNLKSKSINDLVHYMKKNLCDIGTLASKINAISEFKEPNICKVVVDRDIEKNKFAEALDFYRVSENNTKNNYTYHHVGIYAFTKEALIRYVGLNRSNLEVERKLEQLRALENKMKIDVGYIDDCPLSVDTSQDLIDIKKIMESNVKK